MTNQIINQDIRYSDRGGPNNPQSLFSFVKPSRIIITDGLPQQEDGELLWYAIDQTTGILYQKTEQAGGQWQGIYQFSGGAGGITDGSNFGTGNDIFRGKNGSILEFKSIVSQPQNAFESVLNLNDNPLNTEVNITGQSTIANITNYGFNQGQWIFDTDNTITDANGNLQLFAKYIAGGDGVSVVTEQIAADKRLLISNTGILNVVNAEPANPGQVSGPVNGVSSIKNLAAGAGIEITYNPTNVEISTTAASDQHYHYQFQTAISYNVLSTFQNLPPFSSTLSSSDWVFTQNINGSSFVQYFGPVDVVYSFNYDISAFSTLQPSTPFNFNFRIAEGNPLVSQVLIPLSGTLLHFPAQTPNNTTSYNTTSTTFLFKPTFGQFYTLQASCTINNLIITIEEIKLNITKI